MADRRVVLRVAGTVSEDDEPLQDTGQCQSGCANHQKAASATVALVLGQ